MVWGGGRFGLSLVVLVGFVRGRGLLPPPAYAQFFRLFHRTDQQSDLDGQELHVAELDADVAGDDHARVEHSLQNVGQAIAVGRSSYELCLGHGLHPIHSFYT